MAGSAKKFVNEQTVEIEAGGMKGSVTFPIIMTDSDLSTYLTEAQKSIDTVNNWEEGEPIIMKSSIAFDARKHLIRKIQFPGIEINHFRNGERPYPSLVNVLMPLLEPIIDDALNLKNS